MLMNVAVNVGCGDGDGWTRGPWTRGSSSGLTILTAAAFQARSSAAQIIVRSVKNVSSTIAPHGRIRRGRGWAWFGLAGDVEPVRAGMPPGSGSGPRPRGLVQWAALTELPRALGHHRLPFVIVKVSTDVAHTAASVDSSTIMDVSCSVTGRAWPTGDAR